MRIIIKKDQSEIGSWTASYIADKIKKANPTWEKPFVLGLPTGSSPIPVYKEFIRMHKAGELSFKNVVTFNMDEYVGLDENHTESYHFFMYDIKSFKILEGIRGRAACDIPSVRECLMRLSQLALECPQIKELDINPLIVLEETKGCFVADTRIMLNSPA